MIIPCSISLFTSVGRSYNCTMVSPIPMAFLASIIMIFPTMAHRETKSLRHWHRHRRCHPRFSTTFASATRPRCKGRLPGWDCPPAPSVRWSCETRLLEMMKKGPGRWGKSMDFIWIHWWSSSPCETHPEKQKKLSNLEDFPPFSTESLIWKMGALEGLVRMWLKYRRWRSKYIQNTVLLVRSKKMSLGNIKLWMCQVTVSFREQKPHRLKFSTKKCRGSVVLDEKPQ